jgi:hypothetical protein
MSNLMDDIQSWRRQLPYGRYIDNRMSRHDQYMWFSNYHFSDNKRCYTLCKCGSEWAIKQRAQVANATYWSSSYRKFIADRHSRDLSNKKSPSQIKMNLNPEWRKDRKENWKG